MQYVIGCLTQSLPYQNLAAQEGLCTGIGCCQVALSSSLSYHNISFSDANASDGNASGMDGERQCRYAMVVEANKFSFHTVYLNATTFWDEHRGEVPMILNWSVGNETCDVAKNDTASYACRSSNSTASIQLVVLVISATALKATKAILTFLVMADVVCITNITGPYIIQSQWS